MEFDSKQPIYMQIADYIRDSILRGEYASNDRLPSVRDLAEITEVNPNTTMRAFTYLQEKGIIYNKRGMGFYVSGDGHVKALADKRENFIKDELPVFLETMNLLGINYDDLKNLQIGK